MRILVHDYSGHPFQVQLSRQLALRGHLVLHLYSASVQTPHGALEHRVDDPQSFAVEAISLPTQLAKYNYFKRCLQERDYGRRLARRLEDFAPDLVLCSNTPIDVLCAVAGVCRRLSVPWLLWMQDIYSVAIEQYIGQKVPVAGPWVADFYKRRERELMQSAAHIIAISDGFLPVIEKIGGSLERVSVIENWAPVEEISPRPRNNAWSTEHGLDGKLCFLYSGTLGLKHNPDLLVQLARHFRPNPEVRVVVVSEGLGARYLAEAKAAESLSNLVLLPWQSFEALPDVLGTADVLLAILEPHGGVLSVPSKVLSNMAAGRPQLLALPRENVARQIVTRERTGLAVDPSDTQAWIEAAERLLQGPALRDELGRNARAYAERAFDIELITDRFESIVGRCTA